MTPSTVRIGWAVGGAAPPRAHRTRWSNAAFSAYRKVIELSGLSHVVGAPSLPARSRALATLYWSTPYLSAWAVPATSQVRTRVLSWRTPDELMMSVSDWSTKTGTARSSRMRAVD